jgi:anthranilate synthase component 1
MDAVPDFTAFQSAYAAGRPQVVYRRLIADLETPVAAYLKLAAGLPNAFLLESVEGGENRGRYSVIGLKPDLIWRCRDGVAEINRYAYIDPNAFVPDRSADRPLDALKTLVRGVQMDLPPGLPPMVAGLFGYIGYDMVRQIERLPPPQSDPLNLPEAILIRPTIIAVFDNVRDEILLVTPVWPESGRDAQAAYKGALERLQSAADDLDRPLPASHGEDHYDAPGEAESNISHAEYLAAVEHAKEYIRAGDIFQIVPSQRFRRPFKLPPFTLYRSLRRLNPSPYLYFLNFPGFSVIGSSPEILVRLRDGVVTIRPIAGTRPRGKTPAEDAALAEELMHDPKERAEHLMLVDLGRNDVGRVAEIGSVHVTDQFFIERYSHVMHLVSDVEGRIREGLDAVDALMAGFPAGTLSGAPKVRAMEIINELEKEKRGIYAGGVGYFSADGSMDTCIVLRTAIVKDGMMYVQAGGGVVADSIPEMEYQETVNKAKAPMLAADEAMRYVLPPVRGR